MKHILGLLLCLFIVMGSVWSCGSDKKEEKAIEEEKTKKEMYPEAVDFILVSMKGDTIQLTDYRDKVVILDIWDTWCRPCRMEIPDFIDLYKKYNSKGFEMIGIAIGQEGIQKVQSFSDKYGINYPIVIITQKILEDYGPIQGIPTTLVLNKKGQIVKRYVGYREKYVFENDIKKLLDE